MKTFVLTVSRVFPTTHKRKGKETDFQAKLYSAFKIKPFYPDLEPKIHTVRSNYELWAKRIEQIQKGEAILSIRYWSGKPYNSKQVEICQLDKDSGIGVQQLYFYNELISFPRVKDNDVLAVIPNVLAKNDGLSLEDFKEWFKGYDLSRPMAIIHFTKFRY